MTQESALNVMKTGKNIFLTGAPGAGKTYVLNQYIDWLKEYGIEVAVTAPTGIAASHIGGTTIQSFFGTGIKESLSPWDIESLSEKKYLWDRMKQLQVLVIDEVSMLSPGLFESIDQILKTFKFNHEPFGGVQVILVGDFFQLPPISKNESEKRFVFQSPIWDHLDIQTCYLNTSYRQDDEILLNILNEIRVGNVSEDSMNHFRSRYNKAIEGIDSITKLYTHNANVDDINARELAAIDGPPHSYEASTTGQKKWVEKIFNNSLLIPKLELKKGALVFFVKNNYEAGYINGTLGTVIDFDTFDTPIVETKEGKRIKAERLEWTYSDNDGKAMATVKQIPLRLAWAITIHKSQGMTLDAAEIDLSQAFEEGQGYVALSRIASLDGLRLMGLNGMALRVNSEVLQKNEQLINHSEELWEHIENIDTEKLEEAHASFLAQLGGSVSKGRKKKDEEKEALEKARTPKTKSHLETKQFFERELSIPDIAEIRDLTEATIWKHLSYIIEDDPEFDITYLQPDTEIIEAVEKAVLAITKRGNDDDLNQNGEVKLKPIYEELNEAVDYEDIKKALLFLE
ncbi:helicase [Candidatus Campbellbacteria bacterium]|nr:helicase [Candidatus Campbellbacteria bacterium]|tara:strand:+ start:4280 stop:5992 length:1713 start_codon:yes stop_codon:yes gene_type:complete